MEGLLSIIKPIDAPGSLPFLWLSIGLGLFVMFVWPGNRRIGRRMLGAVAGLYVVLALPLVAWVIAAALPRVQMSDPGRLGPLDVLVIFDGDNRRGRVNTAFKIVAGSEPRLVHVLGLEADWIQTELRKGGLPPERVHIDTSTGTTRTQMDWVADLKAHQPELRMAVVASRLQLPRTVGLARAAGVDVPIVGAPADREPPSNGYRLVIPTYPALRVSRDSLYEHAALRYYGWKGWIVR